MVPGRVQNVQLVNFSPDAVEFPVKVLNGGCVLVLNSVVEKARDDGCLADFSGAHDHQPVAILGRYVELILALGHFLNHSRSRSHPEVCAAVAGDGFKSSL